MLLAHGSRDPRAAETAAELTVQVAARLPGTTVLAAYLDHSAPSALDALLDLERSGVRSVRVVPLLFAPGFHIRSDLPAVIDQVHAVAPQLVVHVLPTLAERSGDPADAELLLDALDRRLDQVGALPRALAVAAAGPSAGPPPRVLATAGLTAGPPLRAPTPAGFSAGLPLRALVLAAAGSSDSAARAVIHDLAARWGERHRLPAVAAFASGPGPHPDAAVTDLMRRHDLESMQVGVGSLFLADGFLPGRVARSTTAIGARCAPVLGATPELVELLIRRLGTVAWWTARSRP